jgi:hypothetical protein
MRHKHLLGLSAAREKILRGAERTGDTVGDWITTSTLPAEPMERNALWEAGEVAETLPSGL